MTPIARTQLANLNVAGGQAKSTNATLSIVTPKTTINAQLNIAPINTVPAA